MVESAENEGIEDLEIERKYLLRACPEHARMVGTLLDIEQGYVPGTRINERIRRTRGANGTVYYRTVKAGSGLIRIEVEEESSEAFFLALWPLTRGVRVAKRRYVVREGTDVWEIDEFVDREGLWLAEIELMSAEQVVSIPEWLAPHVVREVTDEPEFTNHALAK